MEELSAQSGVQVKLGDPRDGAGDDLLSFALPHTKLADVMEAVWGLVSYRDGEYQWRRTGPETARVYELWRPLAAQRLPQLLRAEGDEPLKRELLLLRDAATAPKEVLEKLKREHEVVRLLSGDSTSLSGARLFFDVLSPEEQRRVLENGDPVQRETKSLPEYGRQFVDYWFRRQKPFGPDVVDPINGPAWVRFDTATDLHGIGKALRIEVQGRGVYSCSNGKALDDQLLASLYSRWMLPGDAPSSAQEHTTIPASTFTPPRVTPLGSLPTRKGVVQRPAAQRVEELAASSPIPFIIRLRPQDGEDPGPLCGSTVADVLERLCSVKNNFQKKWRGGVLLLTAPDWYLQPYQAAKIPWPTAHMVRNTLRRTDGFPAPTELVSFAEMLSEAQLTGMAPDHLVFVQLRRWRGMLALRRTAPAAWGRLISARGLPISAADVLGPLLDDVNVKGLLADEQAVALGCVFEKEQRPLIGKPGDETVEHISLSSLDAQGGRRGGIGFYYSAEPPSWWIRRGSGKPADKAEKPAGQ